MRILSSFILVGTILLEGCAENPVIQTDGFVVEPILHSIIDTRDSVHFIRMGRLFSGIIRPVETARIPDSIYLDSLSIKVTLTSISGKKVDVPVDSRIIGTKEDGYFDSGDYVIYSFYKKLGIGYIPYMQLYNKVLVEATIPGLPVVRCSTQLVPPPEINSPKRAQQFVFLYPENPIRIQWYGGDWNEIDVAFSVMEEYADSTVTQTYHIQKENGMLFNEGTPQQYCELKIPYELVVQILEQNLKYRTDIIRRYFGAMRIDIHTGTKEFGVYRMYIGGVNDFNFTPYDNIENGIGILSSKSTTVKTALYLDQASRLYLAQEPKLKKFRFIEY